ncbi:Hypothetical protein LBVIB27_04940 [Lactobacillus delbrueckii subsp. bulgaricus]|nr:Hypothetical protein LBVIB27_04940 [Lactobacillus delbrueckii subsp. bulgaricus]
MVFSAKLQETLAGLEEDLDVPSFAVNSDNLIFIDRHVRANKSDPVFAVGTISYADYSGINILKSTATGQTSLTKTESSLKKGPLTTWPSLTTSQLLSPAKRSQLMN